MSKKQTIKVKDIDAMIMEEMVRMKKIEQIKTRLALVNEELAKLNEDGIDEVEVGGTKSGEQWYEKGTPVAKFEKKGSHLKEEDPTMADDMGDGGLDLGGEEELAPETFEEKLASIGRELDAKLAGVGDEPALDAAPDAGEEDIDLDMGDAATEEPAGDEAAEEIEVDATEDGDSEEEIEIDEVEGAEKYSPSPFKENKAVAESEEVVSEEKKDEKVAEECMDEQEKPAMNESKAPGKKVNHALEEEKKRMKRLAGL